MGFKNFKMWRGRLPHWRADDVTYYTTFRHRRELDAAERRLLFRALVKLNDRKFELIAVCVLPLQTELIFQVLTSAKGEAYELSKVIEGAKRKVGKTIIDNTGERFPPFWEESYDRIIRDDDELHEKLDALIESPVQNELVEDPSDYEALFVDGAE